MSADEFAELRASIRDRGLIEPIELYEGQVLDGRHRLQACIDEHCEPRFVEFSGGDPWLRVWDRNGARREWSGGAGQKYAVWRSLKAGSDEWAARQKSIQDAANAARSEKAKARPRNDDGTLTSAPTLSGRTGTRGSSNKGSKSKAAAAGAEPRTCEYHGEDPLGWVVSLNLHRRHLDESQRAIVAAKIANLGDGQRKSASPIGERAVTQGEAAQLLNVGKRSVERAREVLDHGSDELIAAVESGRVSVSAAADVAELPMQVQSDIVARGEREILQAAKRIREQRVEENRFIREGLRVALGKPPRLGRIAQAQHNGDGTHFVAFDVRRFPRETVIACSHDVPALEAA